MGAYLISKSGWADCLTQAVLGPQRTSESMTMHLIFLRPKPRSLLLALLIGFSAKLLFEQWVIPATGIELNIRAIGYLIPGLVANEMSRQRVFPTLAALTTVTILVYLILLLL